MEWKRIREHTESVSIDHSIVTIYYLSDTQIVLIDAGGGECPEFLIELEKRNIRVEAILCTHLHVDHVANIKGILEKHRPMVFAAQAELSEIWAPKDLSVISLSGEKKINIRNAVFEILPTPGHCDGHLAFTTPDGVCCVGDAIMSQGPLRRSKIPFMMNVEKAIASMEMLRETEYSDYVIAHEDIVSKQELIDLISLNIQKELDIYMALRACVTEPMSVGDLVTAFYESVFVRNQFILNNQTYKETIISRINSLIYAGEILYINGELRPAKQ